MIKLEISLFFCINKKETTIRSTGGRTRCATMQINSLRKKQPAPTTRSDFEAEQFFGRQPRLELERVASLRRRQRRRRRRRRRWRRRQRRRRERRRRQQRRRRRSLLHPPAHQRVQREEVVVVDLGQVVAEEVGQTQHVLGVVSGRAVAVDHLAAEFNLVFIDGKQQPTIAISTLRARPDQSSRDRRVSI